MSLSELKEKEVVNIENGASIGKVMDLEFDVHSGCITAIVVPGAFDFFALVRGEKKGLVIPWEQICCIGSDVILVRVDSLESE